MSIQEEEKGGEEDPLVRLIILRYFEQTGRFVSYRAARRELVERLRARKECDES